MTDKFVEPLSQATQIFLEACASLVRRYAIELCFFFNVDSEKEQFLNTDWLSQNIFAGSSIGIPIIQRLYLRPSTCSTAILLATNSNPKVDKSTVFCCFEYHETGAC
jgi:hypothetical protein